jgi:hypothetical protein
MIKNLTKKGFWAGFVSLGPGLHDPFVFLINFFILRFSPYETGLYQKYRPSFILM